MIFLLKLYFKNNLFTIDKFLKSTHVYIFLSIIKIPTQHDVSNIDV